MRMSTRSVSEDGDLVPDPHAAGLLHRRMDAERERLRRRHPLAVPRERLQRVEIGTAGVGVLSRDRAAADIAHRDNQRVADPDTAAEPLVLAVRLEPVDAHVHAEASAVDLVDTERT